MAGSLAVRRMSLRTTTCTILIDFLYGARSHYELATPSIVHYQQRMNFFYLQDDFKITPKLTMNMGIRYEYATPQYERDNLLSNFDPQTNSLIQAKEGSIYDRALIHPDATIGRRASESHTTCFAGRSFAPATASATSTSIAWAVRIFSPTTCRIS